MEDHQQITCPEQDLLLSKKLQLLQIWCVFLYNVEHRCILNVVCSYLLQGRQITLKTLQIYRNSLNIVTQLKDGFLLSLVQKKMEKTFIVKLNPSFFTQLPKLMEKINQMITKELQKIKKFKEEDKKKICVNCKTEKTQTEINFMKSLYCKCHTPNFVDLKVDLDRKSRFQQLQKLLNIIYSKRKQLDELQKNIQKILKEKRNLKEKKISEFEKFCQKFQLQDIQTKNPPNFETLTEAYKLFAPKQNYTKAEQLKRLRQQRKLLNL